MSVGDRGAVERDAFYGQFMHHCDGELRTSLHLCMHGLVFYLLKLLGITSGSAKKDLLVTKLYNGYQAIRVRSKTSIGL